jgi:hypothetical protein
VDKIGGSLPDAYGLGAEVRRRGGIDLLLEVAPLAK